MDTIVTISTPAGRGAIGIVRMSGTRAAEIGGAVFSARALADFRAAEPNRMYYGTVDAGDVRDRALAVLFRAPKSYTGEDVAEFHCHGNMRLLASVVAACVRHGARPADKGEFTRRAFLNGKLSLGDCEGVLEMIEGESAAQINAAYRLESGYLSAEIGALQQQLLDAVAEAEAALDYPEEMADQSARNCGKILENCDTCLQKWADSAAVGKYVADGIRVALAGVANVGKSSLLNRLLLRERAIVTEIAGTTRDSLEETTEFGGYKIRLVDTAGIRETDDCVERLGVERSLDEIRGADVVLFVAESGRDLTDEERKIIALLKEKRYTIGVVNKCDAGGAAQAEASLRQAFPEAASIVRISAKTGEGIEALKKAITELLGSGGTDASAEIITNARHADAVARALGHIRAARQARTAEMPAECVLIDMRNAYRALGEITGETADEAIIDAIFSKFCLGK